MANQTVLLVEDNDSIRPLLRSALQRSGYSVVEAIDGRQGVEQAMLCCPDVILMNLEMPRLDGWAATRIISEREEIASIPIIAFSAHDLIEREGALPDFPRTSPSHREPAI